MTDALEQRTKLITEGSLLTALLRLALPIILGQSFVTTYQLVNTFWVGRLGAAAVAAVSLSGPLVFILISMGGGLSIAGAVFVAQYSGARKRDMVNHVAAQTILMVACIGVSFTIIGVATARLVLTAMGVGPGLMPDALAYLHISYHGRAAVLRLHDLSVGAAGRRRGALSALCDWFQRAFERGA